MNRRVAKHAGGGDGYFVSLNDLLIGILFIFIILLMAFAINYKVAESDLKGTIGGLKNELAGRSSARSELLDKLAKTLEQDGVHVVVDRENGILRLPENALFASGEAQLGSQGQAALQVLANRLVELLPCYTAGAETRKNCPKASEAILEAVYIEGHTDNVPISTGQFKDNWDLSSARAIKTYRFMLQAAPSLEHVQNASGTATLFGASAYADQRPVKPNNNLTIEGRAQNRRIDLRFLLAPPSKVELDVKSGLTVGKPL